ncbi:hypothetical protein SOVF_143940, partial [Spinacia oleracea]
MQACCWTLDLFANS